MGLQGTQGSEYASGWRRYARSSTPSTMRGPGCEKDAFASTAKTRPSSRAGVPRRWAESSSGMTSEIVRSRSRPHGASTTTSGLRAATSLQRMRGDGSPGTLGAPGPGAGPQAGDQLLGGVLRPEARAELEDPVEDALERRRREADHVRAHLLQRRDLASPVGRDRADAAELLGDDGVRLELRPALRIDRVESATVP